MLRRDFVRAVLTVGVAPKLLLAQQSANPAPPPPAPVPWTLGLNPRTPLPHTEVADAVATSEATFFNPVQMQTLARLSDALVPPVSGKPGALEAQVPTFLDFLIGSSPDARRQVYSGGLDWLEAESQKKYSQPFAKLDDTQLDALLKPWLRTWMSDHPPTEAHADFINIAHDDIRTATMNSKAWADASPPAGFDPYNSSLYWFPIEPDVDHPASAPPHVQAVPKSDHPMPSYPR